MYVEKAWEILRKVAEQSLTDNRDLLHKHGPSKYQLIARNSHGCLQEKLQKAGRHRELPLEKCGAG